MRFEQIKDIEKPLFELLISQCKGFSFIETALYYAWNSYKSDGWKYDGATFVKEKNNSYWEVAAFIHDYLNNVGYVGKKPDLYFIKIMITLNYGENIIFERCKWMQYTFLNYFWHWVRNKKPKNEIPNYLKY